jgi:hypothetical protein
MLKMIADIPPEQLEKDGDCLRFLEISKKEIQTEEENKFMEDYTYAVSNEHWELNEWMIKKGLRN